ncbi:MAG TPA: hypothetical protein EYN66_07155 [Myxococcales bacterium]|nr:hypothetical protein [Myxococcales bacterium]
MSQLVVRETAVWAIFGARLPEMLLAQRLHHLMLGRSAFRPPSVLGGPMFIIVDKPVEKTPCWHLFVHQRVEALDAAPSKETKIDVLELAKLLAFPIKVIAVTPNSPLLRHYGITQVPALAMIWDGALLASETDFSEETLIATEAAGLEHFTCLQDDMWGHPGASHTGV